MKTIIPPIRILGIFLLSYYSIDSRAQSLNVSFNLSNHVGYNISCYGGSNGEIETIVTGGYSAAYSFDWSNNVTSQNNSDLPAGDYILSMYDTSNTLVFRDTVTLTQPDSLYAILQPSTFGGYNISRNGGTDGTIDVQFMGGTPPYSAWWVAPHSWIDGMGLIPADDLPAGTYGFEIYDMNECYANNSITLTQPNVLQISNISSPTHYGKNVTCYGGNDGAINLTVSGGIQPYTYSWTSVGNLVPGNTNEDLTGQIAGKYYVQVHSAFGNETKVDSITLTQPSFGIMAAATPHVYPNGFNVSCFHCYNGSISASVDSGGHSPYSYTWIGGPSSATYNGLGGGTYTVIATDVDNCTGTKSATLTEERNEWNKSGDILDTSTTKFLGTIDSTALIIKTKGTERLKISPNGDIQLANLVGSGDRLLKVDATGKITPVTWTEEQNQWKKTGNVLDTSSTRFLGTIDSTSLVIKTKGIERMVINANGNFKLSGLASNSERPLKINQDGVITPGDGKYEIDPGGGTTNPYCSLPTSQVSPWFKTALTGPYGAPDLTNCSNRFGYGTDHPLQRIHVQGAILLDGGSANLYIGSNTSGENSQGEWAISYKNGSTYNERGLNFRKTLQANSSGIEYALFINNIGNVGIGVEPDKLNDDDSEYKLSVNGTIRATRVKVYLGWADYVFRKDYNLRSIEQLESYINENHHLPGIPTAEEVTKNGVDLGNASVQLLEKVEELTLYIIQLNKENNLLLKKVEALEHAIIVK